VKMHILHLQEWIEEVNMKKIEAIIRPCALEELKDVLSKMDINGLTISQVMGCGNQNGWKEYYRGSEIFMNVLPKIEVSVVVQDEKVDHIINTIINVVKTGEIGDGKIFVSDVERVIRIRTGEEGTDALD